MTTAESVHADIARARARLAEVDRAARALYDELEPIAGRFEFEAVPPPAETRGAPLVLILGNHSAGKSTFVNHLLGADIQKTGLAPIDDGFTILAHGASPDEKDGRFVVANADLPFRGLESFGDRFFAHLRLKYRPDAILEALWLVDSPGLIDAADARTERGYDFLGATRWFAERADVVLLMFDPDKPGTTGETMKVLTTALEGLDHKVLIALNKVDRFGEIRDFVRTYGALCWNLSKAIARKDLPPIYNMYVPVPGHGDEPSSPGLPLGAFDRGREEVVEQIVRAPQRRVDNVVSRLYEYARRLRVHALTLDRARREIDRLKLRTAGLAAVAVAVAGLVAWLVKAAIPSVSTGAVLAIGGVGVLLAALVVVSMLLDLKHREIALRDGIDGVFARTFEREFALGDRGDLRVLWATVRDRTYRTLALFGARRAPRLRRSQATLLDRMVEARIPALRAKG